MFLVSILCWKICFKESLTESVVWKTLKNSLITAWSCESVTVDISGADSSSWAWMSMMWSTAPFFHINFWRALSPITFSCKPQTACCCLLGSRWCTLLCWSLTVIQLIIQLICELKICSQVWPRIISYSLRLTTQAWIQAVNILSLNKYMACLINSSYCSFGRLTAR